MNIDLSKNVQLETEGVYNKKKNTIIFAPPSLTRCSIRFMLYEQYVFEEEDNLKELLLSKNKTLKSYF